jgi:hypothetical protein
MTQQQLALKFLISISFSSAKAFSWHISVETAQPNCLLSLMESISFSSVFENFAFCP